MANIPKIHLDSNFCRYPHLVKQWDAYEGLALDMLVYLAAKTNRADYKTRPISLYEHVKVFFLANDFCTVFGHPRQLLHERLSPERQTYLKKNFLPVVSKEIITPIDYILLMISTREIVFNKKDGVGALYQIAGPDRQVLVEWDQVKVINQLVTSRLQEERLARQPISYQMQVLAAFVANNHYRGQGFELADYLNVCTPGGAAEAERKPTKSGKPRKLGRPRTWPAGRRLFLRLIWRWGKWQSQAQANTRTQLEDFDELCRIAGLFDATAKGRASKLRVMLATVCTQGRLPFTAEVLVAKPSFGTLQFQGQRTPTAGASYEIKLTRIDTARPTPVGPVRQPRLPKRPLMNEEVASPGLFA